MPTSFDYETVFEAPSKTFVLAAYFDPDHLATQDRAGQLVERVVLEEHEDEHVRKATWSVKSLKPLPFYLRPFVEGGHLKYVEKMVWRKADDEIDLTILPQIAGGRVHIDAVYQLSDIGPNQVKRRYRGTITAEVKLISGKVERAIGKEIDEGMAVMTECTRSWLKQRGSIGIYLVFALALSIGAGFGVYTFIKHRKPAPEADYDVPRRQVSAERPTPPAEPVQPVSAPIPEAPVPPPVEPTPATRDASEIARVIRHQRAQVTRCVVQSPPPEAVTMHVTLVIGPDGKVVSATSKDPDLDGKLASCVFDVFKKARFPESDETSKITMPIKLEPPI